MNWMKLIIGGFITTAIIWVYTQFIQAMVQNYAGQLESMLMGLPIVMGFFVYVVADYLNQKFNK